MKAFGFGWATPSEEEGTTAPPTATPTATTTTVTKDSHSHGENYGNYRTAPREESSDIRGIKT